MEGERRGEEDTKAEAGFKSSMPRQLCDEVKRAR